MKKVAIVQSNYIPWKGYFDLIASVDELILYDDVQFTKNDWRNRNKIKTPKGLEWLTVPVGQDINRRIRDVTIVGSGWNEKHWKTLRLNYKRASFFSEVSSLIEPYYTSKVYSNLSVLNRDLIEAICNFLGIKTKIKNSWDYNLVGGKTERLVNLCLQAGAKEYISGPAAKAYIDSDIFISNDVKLTWFEYNGYPEYHQLWGPEFHHGVSILDLLFNCGKDSGRYMKKVISGQDPQKGYLL